MKERERGARERERESERERARERESERERDPIDVEKQASHEILKNAWRVGDEAFGIWRHYQSVYQC